jgi:endonuclease III
MPDFTKEWRQNWIKKENVADKNIRTAEIIKLLKKTYPDARIVLNFGNDIQLLVSVILSAQCTDKKVNEVTENLFKKYKTAVDFAKADVAEFEKEIKPTGFYRAKAKNIINACKAIVEKHGGELPRTMNEMLELPGVARKTANVVLGNAYGIVEGIAVDTHVRRLSQRLGLTKNDDPVKIEQDLMAAVKRKDWFELTYLLIDHGRAICIARVPKCAECALNKLCPSSRV